jgi:hypothetical protein
MFSTGVNKREIKCFEILVALFFTPITVKLGIIRYLRTNENNKGVGFFCVWQALASVAVKISHLI